MNSNKTISTDSNNKTSDQYRLLGGDFPPTLYDRLRIQQWGKPGDPIKPFDEDGGPSSVVFELFDDVDEIDDTYLV